MTSPARTAADERGAGGQSGLVVAALFVVLCLIWGFTYIAIKLGLQDASPLAFAFVRALIAGIALGGYALVTTRRFPRDAYTHRCAIILGLTNVAGFLGLLNLGLTRLSAGESSILTYTQPLMVSVLAWLWLRERLRAGAIVGLLVGFAGVALTVLGKVHLADDLPWLGYAYGIGDALAWAVGTVYFRAHRQRLDILWTSALQAIYGAGPLLVLALVAETPRLDLTFNLAWTLLYNGLGSSAVAYLIWFYLLRSRSSAEVTSYVFLVPVFAVGFGAAVLGEWLGPVSLAGGALVLLGIYLVNRPRE
jgi:drug/metabolite transporter (DMT)-like permease